MRVATSESDLSNRVTRSGDFSPKNATNFGSFPANLQKFWAIFRQIVGYSSAKILTLAFFETFWLLLGTQSGSTSEIRNTSRRSAFHGDERM